jgi:hypothetical protein
MGKQNDNPARSVEERYQNDPTFHALVDILYNQITNAQFTPSELREAVILAATRYEMNHVRRYIFRGDEC